jgi:signal transduction histidine kinase
VSNATRHGRAATIRISCRTENRSLLLEVVDDGLGIRAPPERRDGIGLKSMQYRARMIGGALRVAPARDRGTEVAVQVPLASLGPGEPATRCVEPLDFARVLPNAFETTNAGAAAAPQRSQTVR